MGVRSNANAGDILVYLGKRLGQTEERLDLSGTARTLVGEFSESDGGIGIGDG